MKHIAGWFRRNNTIMAQAKDLQRQWQKMREESAAWKEGYYERDRAYNNLTLQLHRVARERDNERKLRLEAEDKLLDYHLDKREKDEEGRAAERGWLADVDNEEE